MGVLKVTGKMELHQFWPDGDSDADTIKVLVGLEEDAFEFEFPDGDSRRTDIFKNAKIRGISTKQVIDKKGRIQIRLQGIDAPELHYSPNLKNKKVSEEQRERFNELNKKYRQYLGETATVKLRKFLAQSGAESRNCTVTTVVDKPNEVFDTYARFVGELVVQRNGDEINVNHWLLQEGLAVPAFYSSMSTEEIQKLISASKQGRKKKKSVWSQLQDRVGKFNEKLVYRVKGSTGIDRDERPLIIPKLFRRLCSWSIYHKAGIETNTFRTYLAKNRDACFLTEEFLEQGATASTTYFLNEFIGAKGKIDFQPEELVFSEKPSKLVDSKGEIITRW